MNDYFGYIRVSTVRQKIQGVSLQEQRAAVEALAQKQGFHISLLFEDHVTATKPGRPQFDEMMRLLKARKAKGVIIHKIDRSVRNYADWADINFLLDSGIEVHLASESIDLKTNGGRLIADFEAVIATNYVRNLREEVKKGIYGRLKQGFFPMPAPLGYLDQGAGKAKLIDPERGPLVRRAFELYATGKYSQVALWQELHRLGLRSKSGKKILQNYISRMLRNPFYMGLIYIEKTKQSFLGAHQPLISKSLFDQVQQALQGNFTAPRSRHQFLFRQVLSCKLCGYSLVAEQQKGRVYYRCQRKSCPTKCVREDFVDRKVKHELLRCRLKPREHEFLKSRIDELKNSWDSNRDKEIQAAELQLAQHKNKLSRLTDAYLENVLDREAFEQRKTALLMEQRGLEDLITDLRNGVPQMPQKIDFLLELLKDPYLQYISGTPEEKRSLVKNAFSNRTLREKNLEISLALPFSEVAICVENTSGGASRRNARTWHKLAEFIFNFARKPLSDQGVKFAI